MLRHVWTNGDSTNTKNYLEGVALNSSPVVELDLGMQYEKVIVVIDYTQGAGTEVTGAFQGSVDGSTYGARQARDIASGVATNEDFTDSKAVSANASWYWEYDVLGLQKARITLGGAGLNGSDVVNVQVSGVSRG